MRSKAQQVEADEGYLGSVSDLMAGLLFVFIVALFAFALQLSTATSEAERIRADAEAQRSAQQAALEQMRNQAQREINDLRKQVTDGLGAEVRRLEAAMEGAQASRAELLTSLQTALEARGIPVSIDPSTGVLRLSDRILFASGRSELSASGPSREAIRVLAESLGAILPCFAAGGAARTSCSPQSLPVIDAVFVEGHTDRRRLGSADRDGNYELSASRALNTYDAIRQAKPELWRLQNPAGTPLMGVSAYGPDRPVQGRESDRDEDLAANRRIEIRFVLTSAPPPELRALRERLERFSGTDGSSGQQPMSVRDRR
jgi:chemotaxis protein MotB